MVFEDENAMTTSEFRQFWDRIGPEQRELFRDVAERYLAERIPAIQAKALAEGSQAPALPATITGTSADSMVNATRWNEILENQAQYGLVRPLSYYTAPHDCRDGGDPDNEYIFYFSYNATDPARLGWDTVNLALLAYAHLWYGGDLKAFGYPEYNLVYVCLGNGAVWAASGPSSVMATLDLGWKYEKSEGPREFAPV